jgi:hypothetical protein
MTNNIHRWIFQIPTADVQTTEEDTTVTGGCFLCGKPLKEEKYFVHLLTNGNLVSTPDEFDENEDMGCFPIGSECRKRLPNNFYWEDK